MHTKNQAQIRRTSEVVEDIVRCSESKDTVSVGEFTSALGERAFGLAILIFALPNSLPVPGIPGFSMITGIPIIFFGIQMMLGKQRLWLPAWIAKKEFSQAKLAKVLEVSIPYLRRMEKFLRPRLPSFSSDIAERVMGVIFIVTAITLSMPIPFGNFLPGIAIAIMSLGLIERDGVVIAIGCLLAIMANIVISAGVIIVLKAAISWFHKMLA